MDRVASEQAPVSAPRSIEDIRRAQRFPAAVAAGIGAAVAGAALWAVVTVVTEMELGLMAIVLGFVVGRAIRAAGQGIDTKFGVLGAACALAGCLLGNLLSYVGFYAKQTGVGFGDALIAMNPELLGKLIGVFFGPMDLLFFAIAIYEGYRFSFRYRVIRATPSASAPTSAS